MDPAKVLQAYMTIMNPQVPQAARSDASAFLEDVKKKPVVCREVALELFKSNNPASRHLGSILFESVVKLHYSSLSPQQKAQVRRDVLLFLSHMQSQDAVYVKEKVCSLVNEVAKRDWPQDWPEYFEALTQISNAGDAQREMVLLVIRRLVEDVTAFSDDLAKTRCDQLMTELKAKSKPMVQFLVQGLQAQQGLWKSSNGQNKIAGRLAVALMETLSGFFTWTAPSIIFDAHIPEILTSFFGDMHPLRMAAAEAMLVLVDQDQGKISIAGKFLFPLERTQIFVTALETKVGTPAQCTLFQQTIGKILVATGKRHLSLVEKHNFPVPANYPDFLNLIGRFLEHSDLVFCETTLPFFNQLLRTEAFRKSPAFDSVVPGLAAAFMRKLVYGINPESLALIRRLHFNDDEDLDDDARDDKPKLNMTPLGEAVDETSGDGKARLSVFINRFTATLKEVLRKVAGSRPQLVLNMCVTEIGKALQTVKGASVNLRSKKSIEFVSFMGCVDLLDAVLRNGVPFDELATKPQQAEPVWSSIHQLVRLFFDFDTMNPLLLRLKVRALRCFSVYYRKNPQALTRVLEGVLGVVLYRTPNEAGKPLTDLDKLTMRVRKEACDAFLRLCNDLSDVLVNQLGQISNHVVEKHLQGDTSFTEKAIIREALMAISTSIRDPAQQSSYVQKVLGPVISAWTHKGMTEVVEDCQKLLLWVGAAPNGTPNYENARALVAVLDTFRAAVKRVPNGSRGLLPVVLPNVFSLCRSLNRLWKPGHAAHAFLRQNMPKVFAPDQRVVETLLGKKSQQSFEQFIAIWLHGARESAYKVIGVSCKIPDFYNIPNLPNILNNFVFVDLTDMAIGQVTMLVDHVVECLLVNTPQGAYQPFLGPFVPHVFAFMLRRLYECWSKESAIKKGENRESADEEVVQTKLSFDFARTMFRTLLHAFQVERNPNLKGKEGYLNASPLCIFLLNTEPIVTGLLAIVSAALCDTCDSTTLFYALDLLERLIALLLTNQALHAPLAGPLFHSLMRAVSKRPNGEHVLRCLRIATEIYLNLKKSLPYPLQILRSIGLSQQQVHELDTRLHAEQGALAAQKKTPKNRASAFQEVLGDWIGKDVIGTAEGPSAYANAYFQRFLK